MPIVTNFAFRQIAAAPPRDLLGPLRGFVGNQTERSWRGASLLPECRIRGNGTCTGFLGGFSRRWQAGSRKLPAASI
jgi:hypothetical protein